MGWALARTALPTLALVVVTALLALGFQIVLVLGCRRVAALGYDRWQSRAILGWSDAPVFAVGFSVSFIAALGAIRCFLRLLATRDLRPFGYYRLAVAGAGLTWFMLHGRG